MSYFTPQEADAVFAQAGDAYSKQNYEAARDGYEKLLQNGFGGADVLYNLGTAELARGNLGGAVLAFERARRVGGRSDDVDANLALARSQQLDRVVGASSGDEPFVSRVVEATSVNGVAVTLVVAWAVGFLVLSARRWLRPGARLGAALVAVACFAIVVPTGALLAAHVWTRENVRVAVVQSASLSAREFPREDAKVSFDIHAGLKVKVLERAGKFVKLRLPNGLEGWAERAGIAEI